jgi:hypothetical protein
LLAQQASVFVPFLVDDGAERREEEEARLEAPAEAEDDKDRSAGDGEVDVCSWKASGNLSSSWLL